jgi:hypothetical protein
MANVSPASCSISNLMSIKALIKSRNTQMSQRKSATLRNLRRRPARPALGNGRIQRACRRAFWAHETPSTSDIIAFAYALRLHRGERRNAFNATVRRTLTAMGAIKIGRGPTRGRPWLWRWKDETSSDNANENNGADQKK